MPEQTSASSKRQFVQVRIASRQLRLHLRRHGHPRRHRNRHRNRNLGLLHHRHYLNGPLPLVRLPPSHPLPNSPRNRPSDYRPRLIHPAGTLGSFGTQHHLLRQNSSLHFHLH